MTDNSLVMDKIVWKNLFSLKVPKSWTVHEEDDLVSLFDEYNGVGVLQMSFAERQGPQPPTANEALEFSVDYAKQRNWNVSFDSIHILTIGDSPASRFSVTESQGGELNYWTVWHIVGRERVSFITYNCLESDKLAEEKICNSIVGSFRWLSRS